MVEMKLKNQFFNLAVIVAAFGYFVDIYDLLLFTIVREPSLMGIQVPDAEMIVLAHTSSTFKWSVYLLEVYCGV